MSQYENEVQERWGNTDAYKQSHSKTSKYSKDDFQAAKVDQEAATELFVYAFGNSLPIDSDKTKAAAVKDVATYILSSKCSGDKGAALGFSVIDGALKAKSLAQIAKIG